jgi:L-lactate dehydrogenase complex protein LldF
LNVCPVYQNIGGHSYDSTYSGPIGSVITPHLTDLKSNGHLSYASTLCGACTETCPVGINIHGLLMENRRQLIKEGYGAITEKVAWRLFKQGMLHRSIMNMAGGKTKNLVFQKLFSQAWGGRRATIEFAPKSFNQLWEKRRGEHKKEKS